MAVWALSRLILLHCTTKYTREREAVMTMIQNIWLQITNHIHSAIACWRDALRMRDQMLRDHAHTIVE
jgi:hypothetical protein